MSDNWEKLLQLSVPREDHRDSSTGLLEETNPNRSILDLRSKSPPLESSLEKTEATDVTELSPAPLVNPELFWGGPEATSINDSADSIESSVRKMQVYHDSKELTESGDESSGVQETTQSIMKGIIKARDNIAQATEAADRA